MSDSTIGLIVTLVMAAAVVVFLILRNRKEKSDMDLLSPEDQKRHADIVVADHLVKDTQRVYDTAVKQAADAVAAARTPRTLASAGPITITETSILVNGNARPLTPGITAQVDASGDVQKYATSRTTATRVVAGAVLFGPVGAIVGGTAKKGKVHTQDTRQLYLIVTGPDWQEVVQLHPDLGTQARQFAATLYNLAPHAAQHLHQFQTRVVQAEQAHRAAMANTGPLEAAKQARSVLELDPLDELRKARATARKDAKMASKAASTY